MRLAFVGLGAIGGPIARRLAQHPDIGLSLYDTRPEALEAHAGHGRLAASVADALADVDAIFTVLPADEHVLGVAGEVRAAARPGQMLLDFSTIAPRTMEQIAAGLDAVGVHALGGALTRSVAAAETGDLSIFVGGAAAQIERVRPALDQMASDVRVVDTVAAAKALKILNNLQVSSLGLVICDALLVGVRHGVEPETLVAALQVGGADSWPLRNHIAKHLLPDDLAPGRFSVRYMGKDAALAARLAADRGEPAAFAGVVRAAYRGAESLGFGEHYHPIVMRWLEHAAHTGPTTPRRTVGAVTPAAGSAAAQAKLVHGTIAQQALITFDALRLVVYEGVAMEEALEHFQSGSASNDCVRALRGIGATHAADEPFGALADALGSVCALAAEVSVPAITFEVGRQVALSWASRYGPDATLPQALRLND